MKILLKNIITKLFVAFMAVQIINLSFDAIEFEPLYATNDLGNFNYMNSMSEYIVEILLHHDDAFPEYQSTHSSSTAQALKHIPFKIISMNEILGIKNYNSNYFSYTRPFNETRICSYIREINPPPPKQKVV